MMKKLMMTAIAAAYEGGKDILDVYNSEFDVDIKGDNSPLTLADQRAHITISKYLEATAYPVLSEEGRNIPFSERGSWERFWMVDPLDGTKEFVKRNGEFTVNIALIENGKAIAGVIYVPVKDKLYFGFGEEGAFSTEDYSKGMKNGEDMEALISRSRALPFTDKERPFTAVGSRSHMSPETETFFEELRQKHGEIDVVSMGSSLKICLVAEGVADVYPRFAPTMEWDTAAGHGIVTAAGKEIMDYTTKEPMRYNKENLLNNWFIVS